VPIFPWESKLSRREAIERKIARGRTDGERGALMARERKLFADVLDRFIANGRWDRPMVSAFCGQLVGEAVGLGMVPTRPELVEEDRL
jgi:hypothetical protein